MSAHVIIITPDSALADIWERQLPTGRIVLRAGRDTYEHLLGEEMAAVLIVDLAAAAGLRISWDRYPAIIVGEPKTFVWEQAKLSYSGRAVLSYEESQSKILELFPLVEEIAEKQALVRLMEGRERRAEPLRDEARSSNADSAEFWDFIEGAVENLDSRERLLAEFRRSARSLLRASHVVFFLREMDGYRADRGTSFLALDDPLVAFFERRPTVIDGTRWEERVDPVAELAARNRLALWGARLLVPIHDNGRLLGIIALGVRNDGQNYDEGDRNRAIFFARILRNFLSKASQFLRLTHTAAQVAIGSRYLPGSVVLGSSESAPRHLPLVVRDLIGQVRRTKEVVRIVPCVGQPFRASGGPVLETGGVWACWEEASAEVHDVLARDRLKRKELLRELSLTLSHELGNSLVSLVTFRQASKDRPLPSSLIETIKNDIMQLEGLNSNLSVMQRLYEGDVKGVDVRELIQSIGGAYSIRVDVGPDPIMIMAEEGLLEFALRGFLAAVLESRKKRAASEILIKVRATGSGSESTALVSIKGKELELEGIIPEPEVDGVPNQGRMSVFLAKEILRLHGGEIHAGPGMDGVEILLSIRSRGIS